MKNYILKVGKISFMLFLSGISLFASCKIIDSEEKIFKDLSPSELAEVIFDDEEFQELRILENKHMFNSLIMRIYPEELKKRDDKLLFYSKKIINTLDDRNDFSTALGFDDFTEMIKYSKLMSDLDKKYKITEFDEKRKSELLGLLTEKQIEFAFDENSINSFHSLSKSSENARIQNTCMFCAYDYMGCRQGHPVSLNVASLNILKGYNPSNILLYTQTWTSTWQFDALMISAILYDTSTYVIEFTITDTDTYYYEDHNYQVEVKKYSTTPGMQRDAYCSQNLQNCMAMAYPGCY